MLDTFDIARRKLAVAASPVPQIVYLHGRTLLNCTATSTGQLLEEFEAALSRVGDGQSACSTVSC
jgi:hypothetical protein